MSDHFPGGSGQDDAALAPDLARLDELLLAEGQRWRRNEPSTARLERHVQALARSGATLPRNEERMLSERNQALETPTPQPILRPTPPRGRGLLALVATVLLVAMAASVFAYLSARSVGTGTGQHTAKAKTTTTPSVAHVTAIQPPNTFLPMPKNSYLSGLSFSSAHDGWAVGGLVIPDFAGQNFSAQRGVLVHYHDGMWMSARDSFPGMSLSSVSMVSADDGWAVGMTINPPDNSGGVAVLLHYTGGHWMKVDAPALKEVAPQTIRMLSPDFGYITGTVNVPSTIAPGSGSVDSLVEIAAYQNGVWNAIPTPFASYTSQVVMLSAGEGWASAQTSTQTVVYHYFNGVWTKSLALSDDIASLSATSSADVWALAVKCLTCATPTHTSLVQQPLIYHYNGSTWTAITPPDNAHVSIPSGEDFTPTIFDDGASGVWVSYALTEYSSGGWNTHTSMWRYTGNGGWKLVSLPIAGGNVFTLTTDGNGGVWAIAQNGNPFSVFVLYTQGNDWKVYGRS